MKLQGFIGEAYALDSANVDAQRCVNLYPEVIGSGRGKEGQVAYLKSTPGLTNILTVGDGPIRCIHTDSIGRVFIVSGNKLYFANEQVNWKHEVIVPAYSAPPTFNDPNVNISTEVITMTGHGLVTGVRVTLDNSIDTPPTPLLEGTEYFIIRVDDNTLKFAATNADAASDTPINLTALGGGVNTVSVVNPETVTGILNTGVISADDTFDSTNHLFYTGLMVTIRTTGTLPTGLALATNYYVNVIDANTFELCSTLSNATAGTPIDITKDTSDWVAKLVGTDGLWGGDSVNFATSTGIVKAASMSSQGDGTDSSTLFVDGSQNYLYEDGVGGQTLAAIADTDIALAEFVITSTNFSIYITDSVSDWLGKDVLLRLQAATASAGEVDVTVTSTGTGIAIFIYPSSDTTITSLEFMELLNTGAVVGKTVNVTDSFGYMPILGGSGGDTTDMVSAGGGGYILGSGERTVEFVADTISGFGFGSVPTATDVVWSDGYFIVNQANTNKFFISDLQSFNISALSFASSEGSPDIVKGFAINRRDLYIFNDVTTEIFANTGNADFPFERVQGGFLEIGCAAQYSIARIDNTVFWLGRSKDGEGGVYSIQGLQYKTISTHAIEQAIASYADISTATAYTYKDVKHNFYVLNFAEATWVYDLSTGLWHERAFTNAGVLERHRIDVHSFHPRSGKHIVGDYSNSKVYVFSNTVYKDDTDAITRLRSSPHISSELNRIFYNKFQLDMETGIGLDGGVQGSSPTVMLDFSNDGGHTWSSESYSIADAGGGDIGEYKARVIWRRLGEARDRIFRVKITDPVPVILIDAQIDVEKGSS